MNVIKLLTYLSIISAIHEPFHLMVFKKCEMDQHTLMIQPGFHFPHCDVDL